MYIAMGMAFMKGGSAMFPTTGPNGGPPPEFMGWMFVGIGGAIIFFGWVFAALNCYSARSMQKRKRRVFSLVISGLNCMSFPFGTALGVFTFVVLLRQSVSDLYRNESRASYR
jgi:hypothetical protein